MIYKLAQAAEKSWNRLRGHNQLPKVILGVKFNDGMRTLDYKLNPLPPDPSRHQDLAVARTQVHFINLKTGKTLGASDD